MKRLILMLTLSGALTAVPAWAQDSSGPRTERPATATYWGDTGLWFVPTAETVKPGGFSFSVYRTEFDFKQGVTDLSDWPITAAVGAGPRTEVFGALRVVTRIDRDLRPLFEPGNQETGGVTNDNPFVRETWTGNQLGDLLLGGKFNILTEHNQQPFALAVRGTVKLPTASEENGAGTGEFDYFPDIVLSKEISRRVEISGYTGYAFRGDPDGVSVSDSLRWGLGAAFGARSNLRFTAEMFGEQLADDDVITVPGAVTGTDGSFAPILSQLSRGVTTAFGLTWQHPNGLSLGAGVTYQFGLENDATLNAITGGSEGSGHAVGMQFRLGFHNGVRMYVPPAPPRVAEAAPAAPAPPGATAKPAAPPPPPAAAAAAPARSAEPAAAKALALDEVHFDFDMDQLRPDAIQVLDRVVDGLKQNPGTRVRIEGHASFEGTAEYNLVLGERRAARVRDYLVSRGIPASSLDTLSKGEESPKYDNLTENGRALNRRAEFIIQGR
ncbi:MAG TPA: OmpA family protein [Vicinamibacterales bacterium]|nr:OmpA family protein [Vicinamibacterales bacterium]